MRPLKDKQIGGVIPAGKVRKYKVECYCIDKHGNWPPKQAQGGQGMNLTSLRTEKDSQTQEQIWKNFNGVDIYHLVKSNDV